MPVGEFWIDRYEVTISEYNQFLDAIAAGAKVPEHAFAGKKNHQPAHWTDIVRVIEQHLDARLCWDSPIVEVDWFDAYAYAAWRGKRLPAENEWKRAGVTATNQKWAPVYVGAGVSEWTSTAPTRDSAVVCGSSRKPGTPSRSVLPRETRSEVVGFRCAADKEVK